MKIFKLTIRNTASFAALTLINHILHSCGITALWIQRMWNMLYFWIFIDSLILQNDLSIIKNNYQDLQQRYSHLEDLYRDERTWKTLHVIDSIEKNASHIVELKNLLKEMSLIHTSLSSMFTSCSNSPKLHEISTRSPKCIHHSCTSPIKEEDFENITQRRNAFLSRRKSHSFHVAKKSVGDSELMHKRNLSRKSSM
jgi:hypothetical protein